MSPFVTVGVLAVLWLIVVVPMIVRRNDEVARDRSIREFGRAMRALGRRSDTKADTPLAEPSDPEVFVAGHRESKTVAVRRPVPADSALQREGLMYPVDRSEMSAARASMMARRRRSLAILGIGSLVSVLFALVAGGLIWLVALVFVAGLVGYLGFLRTQARKGRTRRSGRRERWSPEWAPEGDEPGYDVSDTTSDETVVRIDDDDLQLQTMDTIDLTGLYPADEPEVATERKAS